MSPSMMEGLILELFCLRNSCAVDLSERVSGVAHLCKSFHTRCNFPEKWVVYHLEFFRTARLKIRNGPRLCGSNGTSSKVVLVVSLPFKIRFR